MSAHADSGHFWACYWRLWCGHHSLRKLRGGLTAADLRCPIAWTPSTQRDLQAHCQRHVHIHAWPLRTVLLLSRSRCPQPTHVIGSVRHGRPQQRAAPSKVAFVLLPWRKGDMPWRLAPNIIGWRRSADHRHKCESFARLPGHTGPEFDRREPSAWGAPHAHPCRQL